jgi:hypothetical protein
MEQVRRADDDELCGHVAADGEVWVASTVFGAELGRHATRAGAVRQVEHEGLAVLAERWTLVDIDTAHEQVVCIVEANATEVTVALDYYALPGVPTRTISVDDLVGDRYQLRR